MIKNNNKTKLYYDFHKKQMFAHITIVTMTYTHHWSNDDKSNK